MTVAQFRSISEILAQHGMNAEKKVNFTIWRDQTYVTLSFMNPEGEFWRYDIQRDGSYTGEQSV